MASGPWRVGRHYPIHVYEDNRPVATFFDADDAAAAVAAHNAELDSCPTGCGSDEGVNQRPP